ALVRRHGSPFVDDCWTNCVFYLRQLGTTLTFLGHPLGVDTQEHLQRVPELIRAPCGLAASGEQARRPSVPRVVGHAMPNPQRLERWVPIVIALACRAVPRLTRQRIQEHVAVGQPRVLGLPSERRTRDAVEFDIAVFLVLRDADLAE